MKETVDLFSAYIREHRGAVRLLRSINHSEFIPYCNLLIERIESHVLPVLEDGIEALTLLNELSHVTLPRSMIDRLEAAVERAHQLKPHTGSDGHGP